MLLNILLLIIGLFLLVRGADAFVDGAAALARRFNIPEIIIGLTIVAMGTSAPEAAVSISSVLHGANGVTVGNIIGSNIANILLILGIVSLISPLYFEKNTVKYEIPFVIFITVLLMWFGAQYGEINRFAAVILTLLFVLFLGYLYIVSKNSVLNTENTDKMSWLKISLYVFLGLIALVVGSKLTVFSAINLAKLFHVSGRVIGLTMVAVGTSLPELVTCVIAARKKHTDLVIGNIIGSNIFNVLFVLGITGIIHPINFESPFLIDSAIAVMTAVVLWLFAIYYNKLLRFGGILFLLAYAGYMTYLI